mgnify:CR=1 FL=1
MLVGNTAKKKMKIYYEPNDEVISLNSEVLELADRFECLEYAIADGKIDSINYHLDGKQLDDIIAEFKSNLANDIQYVFDASFVPYTLGYRFNGGKSVYYYPTVWKEKRFGIRGITDCSVIKKYIKRFLLYISASKECKDTIKEQLPYVTKFKGVCITNFENKNSYKLYYRMNMQGIRDVFGTTYDIEKYCDEYGEVVLISVGIMDGDIVSYNFYFLR